MSTRLARNLIVFSFVLMCGKNVCMAQSDSCFEVSARKVNVADTNFIALLDTMHFIANKCGIDMSSLFFYICESDFDGGNRFFGKALLYEAGSYREMWNNGDLNKTDDLFWETYYFYHKEVLCICNVDHENLFEDVSKYSDILLLPLNIPQKKSFYLVVVPRISGNHSDFNVYMSCD